MKVAIIGTAHPYRGGLASYNDRLAQEFVAHGHDVTVYTFTLQYPKILFPGKSQYSEEPSPANIQIVRCVNAINPINWISVGNRIAATEPDIVIVKFWLPFMGPCFGTILRRIKRKTKAKIVSIVDNMIPHESRAGDKAFTNYFVKPVDGFVAMSDSVYQDIELFDKTKPKTLSPHPLFDNFGEAVSREKALNSLGLSPHYRYILFFGLIRKYKGLDLLLAAMGDVLKGWKSDQKLKLIIAGEYYADKQFYQGLIDGLGLESHVIETDKFIADSEVKLYFCASDIVVQPYKSATQSGVTQIAYHFNTPMIVTDVGGLSELCPHEEVGYVVPCEADSIGEAIERFYRENKQREFESNIEQEKKQYAWNIMVDKILKLVEEL